MTDVQVETQAEAGAAQSDDMFTVPLFANLGEVTVNSTDIPIETYRYIFQQGLEAVINSVGMSKLRPGITKLQGKEAEDAKAKVLKQARDNVEAILKGEIKRKGSKAKAGTEVSQALMTEAMRIAQEMVKDHIKRSGQRIGAYKASERTKAAKDLVAGNPHILELARKNLSERAEAAKTTSKLDLKALFGAKAESEEVKAKPKGGRKANAEGGTVKPTLSATQAGKVAPRQKPAAEGKVPPKAQAKPTTEHHTAH